MMKTRSNTLSTLIIRVTVTTASTGASRGTVIRRNTCHSLAPSTRAASSSSRGMPASPAAISTIAKPAHIQMYEPTTAGVTSDGPSQSRPLYGSWKLLAGSRSRAPSAFADRENAPSAAAVAVSTTVPSPTASIFMPG
ncbi:hypothetical protein SHIRM173S_02156 [Streptomyces hirsutus]